MIEMGGETEQFVSGWTTDTLHTHLLTQLDGLRREMNLIDHRLQERYETQETGLRTALTAAEKAVEVAVTSAEKAVLTANIANEKRFESVNEFRGQLADQVSTFATRNEVGIQIQSLAEKLEAQTKLSAQRAGEIELRLTSRLDLSQGERMGQPNVANQIAALVARVDELRQAQSAGSGHSSGISQSWGALLGVVMLISTMIAIFLALKG
jgi:hypothetical protein